MAQEAFLESQIVSIGIYPPIAFARVGNSTQTAINEGWYYGPEVAGRFDTPEGGFKDAYGAVKRQAARFRVYGLDASGNAVKELNRSSGFELKWSVSVANKKPSWYAFMGSLQQGSFKEGYTTLRNPDVQPDLKPDLRDKLIVASGVVTVEKPGAEPKPLEGKFYGSNTEPTPIYLGEISTDEEGRLVVKAGRGKSMSIATPGEEYPLIMNDFDSPNWIDDTCDGWVNVEISRGGLPIRGLKFPKARVVGTTPKFVNGVYAPTTLYDVIEDVYERRDRGLKYKVGKLEYYKDIWPLLERPALLSWVNIQAYQGHGPGGPGDFFEESWQKVLSDNSPENEPIRKGILGRMRLPSTNEKYAQARTGQAYPYFMPWLSGDGGRTTAGDPTTFTSVTELQYDRLVEWAAGNFTKGNPLPQPPVSVEQLPINEQPGSLTKASLEHTIGAPLYPGIELSWNAELDSTYDQRYPFTVSEAIPEGDLTKFLSLPWQSDFYMCRSYWWPSARPDSIVPEESYREKIKAHGQKDIAKFLTERTPWERGLHENYTDVYESQPLFANTDMAQRWHQLGFIVQMPSEGQAVYVETQRGDLGKPQAHKLSHIRTLDFEPLQLAQPESEQEPITTLESLHKHLQIAIAVELSTIPLYLFGMYSVKTPAQFVNDPRYQDPIVQPIRNVVAEEMLHLSLAGNILLATGGTPRLYDNKIVPRYPANMLYRQPPLMLNLRKMTKENVETFYEVELPEPKNGEPQPDEYNSLGQFYKAIEQGLLYLSRGGNIFKPETADYQFSPGMGYQARIHDAGGSVVIKDLESAHVAIKTIIDQGEGASGSFDDKEQLEKSHFEIFKEMLEDPKKQWEVYDTVENPTTDGYAESHPHLHAVSLAFDASYCFLLLTIERLWTIKNSDSRHKLILGNMYTLMMGVLAPLSKFFLQQPMDVNRPDGKVAAPCFNFYEFDMGRSQLEQLQEVMQNAIMSYVSITQETPDQVAVHNYGPQLNLLLPIQASIATLLDLDTFTKISAPTVKANLPGVHATAAKGFAKGF